MRPEQLLPAIHGPAWGYRHRARLTVRYVPKKGGALVGFHEKRSSYVADMDSCEVLPRAFSDLLRPLRDLVNALSIRSRLPQIEIAAGDEADVLVLRVLEPLLPPDVELLRRVRGPPRRAAVPAAGRAGYGRARCRAADEADLYYTLPEFDLKIRFGPTDFTQVNHAVNRVLVRCALALLDPQPGERVADLFCGIGNFTLAIARRGAVAVGVEGSAELVRRAAANAAGNGLADAAQLRRDGSVQAGWHRLAALGPIRPHAARPAARRGGRGGEGAAGGRPAAAWSTFRATRERSRGTPRC